MSEHSDSLDRTPTSETLKEVKEDLNKLSALATSASLRANEMSALATSVSLRLGEIELALVIQDRRRGRDLDAQKRTTRSESSRKAGGMV